MKNNQGFTLVELIATIVILAIVLSITGYSITSVITSARTKNYELLITDINSAAELYYQECNYMAFVNDSCGETGFVDTITLGFLVDNGYLTSNNSDIDSILIETEPGVFIPHPKRLINPKTTEPIVDCLIKIEFTDKIKVTAISETDNCPEEY